MKMEFVLLETLLINMERFFQKKCLATKYNITINHLNY